jgi:hypothetical protein
MGTHQFRCAVHIVFLRQMLPRMNLTRRPVKSYMENHNLDDHDDEYYQNDAPRISEAHIFPTKREKIKET